MSKPRKELFRWIVVGGGAGSCLLVSIFGIVMILYWHHVTGSWLDDHIFFWQPIGVGCIGGVFLFTSVIDKFFE